MKKWMALILTLIMLSGMLPTLALGESTTADTAEPLTPVTSLVDADGNVIFNDSLVEKAIRDSLGIPDGSVTKKQIAKLGSNWSFFSLYSETPRTADLSVLQLCPKLKLLALDNVTPKNWSAIAACKGVSYFGATHLKLTDLNFLLGLKGLYNIDLRESTCEDISAVTKLTKLYSFACDTTLKDITPLYTAKMKGISLSGLTDEQVNALLDAQGKKLTNLGLKDTTLSDATLARIQTLKISSLSLNNVTIGSASPWLTMQTLKWELSLSNMKVDSLEGIQNLKKLKYISLNNIEGLTDYSPLYQMGALKSISITDGAAPNLQGIESLKKLTELWFDGLTGTIDITPIFALSNLNTLGLMNTQITSIDGIEALTKLKSLYLYGTKGIQDYTPLTKLKKIQSIYADDPSLLPAGLPVY